MTQAHVALYGTVAMQRQHCDACKGTSLVIRGKLACCDRPVAEIATTAKRMSESENVRKQPSRTRQKNVLKAQGNRCLYCEVEFGTMVNRGTYGHRLTVAWDHLVPFSYSASCADSEFVAACDICNNIKSSSMFQTLEEARTEIALQRSSKGWSF